MRIFTRKRSRPLVVAILGSGPAALFAAQAVYDTGNIAVIWSRGTQSKLYGAQYLHEPVPGLDCGNRQRVNYVLKGNPDSYRRKVYGDITNLSISPDSLESQHDAWDIRSAYEQAWAEYKGLITHVEITTDWLSNWRNTGTGFDLTVWSLPLAQFCVKGHAFQSRTVWAQGDAPDLGLECSVEVPPWTVVCNGEDSPRWYRASNVFGHRTAEWPDGPKPPIKGLVRVEKPIRTNCDCWPTWAGGCPVIRVGRYGTWAKGELSHMAYLRTRTKLETM